VIECFILCKHAPVVIGKHEFLKNLLKFNMLKFDIILGMDCLTIHGANIDCKDLKVNLRDQKRTRSVFS